MIPPYSDDDYGRERQFTGGDLRSAGGASSRTHLRPSPLRFGFPAQFRHQTQYHVAQLRMEDAW